MHIIVGVGVGVVCCGVFFKGFFLTNLLSALSFRWLVAGKYYAVEDMLTTDPSEKFGTITLQEHYNRIAVEGQEYDPYTTMVSEIMACFATHFFSRHTSFANLWFLLS